MAFFGLTSLGAQNHFQAALADALDLTLFSEAEFSSAFKKLDKDNSGYLDLSEVGARQS